MGILIDTWDMWIMRRVAMRIHGQHKNWTVHWWSCMWLALTAGALVCIPLLLSGKLSAYEKYSCPRPEILATRNFCFAYCEQIHLGFSGFLYEKDVDPEMCNITTMAGMQAARVQLESGGSEEDFPGCDCVKAETSISTTLSPFATTPPGMVLEDARSPVFATIWGAVMTGACCLSILCSLLACVIARCGGIDDDMEERANMFASPNKKEIHGAGSMPKKMALGGRATYSNTQRSHVQTYTENPVFSQEQAQGKFYAWPDQTMSTQDYSRL